LDSYQHERRRRWAMATHGGLERQRNDRLGRIWILTIFEHRREILRAVRPDTNTNAHSNTNTDGDTNRNSHVDAHTDGYGHRNCDSDCRSNGNSNPHGECYRNADSNGDSYSHGYGNGNSYRDSNANAYTDAMHGKMFTHAEAAPDFGWATHSAPSFNTAAYCFTERHRSAAANSASSPHTTTDAYRFPAPDSSTPPIAHSNLE